MALRDIRESFSLETAEIHALCGRIGEYLRKMKAEPRDCERIARSAESLLLQWQTYYGASAHASVQYGSRLGRLSVRFSIAGAEFRPEGESRDAWLRHLMAEMELELRFSYVDGRNVLSVYPRKKKLGNGIRLLEAILLALLCGALGRRFLSAQQLQRLAEQLLSPLYDTFLGLIGMLAGPLIFCSVLTGVCGSSDTASFKRIGRRILCSNLLRSLLAAVLSCPVIVFFLRIPVARTFGGMGDAYDLLQMALDILPDNLLSPFLTGNSLQIVVLASALGMAALTLGERAVPVIAAADTVKQLLYVLMEWITSLMSFIIFTVLLKNILADTMAVLLQSWKPVVLLAVLALASTLPQVLFDACVSGLGTRRVLRAIGPATLIGLTTASSTAAFGEMTHACTDTLGVRKTTADVAIPLGLILVKFTAAIEFLLGCCYAAEQYGVECSIPWLLTAIVSSVLLAIAMPPVAGGALSCFSVLFLQCGIPTEAVALAIAMDIVTDFLLTACHTAVIQTMTMRIAAGLDGSNEKRSDS